MKRFNAITDVPGIRVGHASDFKALTGCTIILCENGPASKAAGFGVLPAHKDIGANPCPAQHEGERKD